MLSGRRVRYMTKKWRKPSNFYKSARGTARGTYNIANKALDMALKVKRLVNVEFKYIDTVNTQSVASTGHVIPITQTAQGDAADTRDGNKLKLTSMFIRLYGEHNNSGATSQMIRFIVFRDNMQRGATPAVTDVLSTANVISPNNKFADGRFTILIDKMIIVSDDKAQSYRKIYKELNSHVNYIGATAVEASNGVGSMYMLMVSNEASINYPDVVYNVRLRYVDN